MKTAVVLFNIGGPDKVESISPFLKNFFNDPNIIRLPGFLRRFIAARIAKKRSQGEALEAYAALGGKSPLLENTQAQSDALEAVLQQKPGGNVRAFVCMRYWHPMSAEVVEQVKDFGPDQIVLLPLYPQFSTTTTRSSFQDWENAARDLNVPVFKIGCYPFQPGFLEASAALVGQTLRRAQIENPETPLRILFSAHGLPESIIRSGDPYQWQCEQTAKKIAEYMDIPGLDWQACYQSRVGPMKWIGPSTDQALETAAKDRVGVIIYPHAFVSEHVETLVEIEEEYRHAAEKLGVPCFYRVPTVGTDPVFIAGLAELVEENLNSGFSPPGCPAEFKDCCQRAVA